MLHMWLELIEVGLDSFIRNSRTIIASDSRLPFLNLINTLDK